MRILDIDAGEEELAPGQVGEGIVQALQIVVGCWERPTETATMILDGTRRDPGGRGVYAGDNGTIDQPARTGTAKIWLVRATCQIGVASRAAAVAAGDRRALSQFLDRLLAPPPMCPMSTRTARTIKTTSHPLMPPW